MILIEHRDLENTAVSMVADVSSDVTLGVPTALAVVQEVAYTLEAQVMDDRAPPANDDGRGCVRAYVEMRVL